MNDNNEITLHRAIVLLRTEQMPIKNFMELAKEKGWNLKHFNRLVEKHDPMPKVIG